MQIWFALLLLILVINVTLAAPNEVKGNVTRVISGDTFDVQDFGRVRLADIYCSDPGTPDGDYAKAYTEKQLLNKTVYLDVDNLSGQDSLGRWFCVAYLSNSDGTIDVDANFNRALVDIYHAIICNSSDNEFDPRNWWEDHVPGWRKVKGCPIPDFEGSLVMPVEPSFRCPADPEYWGIHGKQDPYYLKDGDQIWYKDHMGLDRKIYLVSEGRRYLGDRSTKLYHAPSCPSAQGILPENQVWFYISEEAQSYNFRPCPQCNPP